MPTPIELGFMAVFIPAIIAALNGYGKLRDEMSTIRAEINACKTEDKRNAEDITKESRRNDMQDQRINEIMQLLVKIDTNVNRLLEIEAQRTHAH